MHIRTHEHYTQKIDNLGILGVKNVYLIQIFILRDVRIS